MHHITKYQVVSCFAQRPYRQTGDSETQRHRGRRRKGGKGEGGRKKSKTQKESHTQTKQKHPTHEHRTLLWLSGYKIKIISAKQCNHPFLCMVWLFLLHGDSLALGLVGMWRGLWLGVLWAVSMMCICVYIHECVCACVSWLCRYNCGEVRKEELQGQGGVAHQL